MRAATIRYLGWLAENLTGDIFNGYPSVADLRAAHKCCDRIEHIAQYVIEGLPWDRRACMLEKDVDFMRRVLANHAEKLGVGHTNSLPTPQQLDALQAAINNSLHTCME